MSKLSRRLVSGYAAANSYFIHPATWCDFCFSSRISCFIGLALEGYFVIGAKGLNCIGWLNKMYELHWSLIAHLQLAEN